MADHNSPTHTATAVSCSNIAFIKYWGNRDQRLHIPANGSISMNLSSLRTRTRVRFDPSLPSDELILNGQPADETATQRVTDFLSLIRQMAGIREHARVESENNFPMGTGIASSASAFAALSLAASAAAGLNLDEKSLSRLARRGSGSACRSIPSGFVEWHAGSRDEDSYAYSLAPPEHWALNDCVAVVSREHKPTGSIEGHPLADTSPVHTLRVQKTPKNLALCRQAIRTRDFEALAQVTEADCNLMHAVMLTSNPALIYWQPATLAIIHAVQTWRQQGYPVCYTIDAGPNVHVICEAEAQPHITAMLREIPGVEQVLVASPGGPTYLKTETAAG